MSWIDISTNLSLSHTHTHINLHAPWESVPVLQARIWVEDVTQLSLSSTYRLRNKLSNCYIQPILPPHSTAILSWNLMWMGVGELGRKVKNLNVKPALITKPIARANPHHDGRLTHHTSILSFFLASPLVPQRYACMCTCSHHNFLPRNFDFGAPMRRCREQSCQEVDSSQKPEASRDT